MGVVLIIFQKKDEFLKRYYQHSEYPQKIVLLAEYYKVIVFFDNRVTSSILIFRDCSWSPLVLC
jgi:hypothetical protein